MLFQEEEQFWSEEIERQKSKVRELNRTVEVTMHQRTTNELRNETIEVEMLRTEVEKLRNR